MFIFDILFDIIRFFIWGFKNAPVITSIICVSIFVVLDYFVLTPYKENESYRNFKENYKNRYLK